MSAVGVLMYSGKSRAYNMDSVVYRHRIKGSQQAYVFCGPKDADEYAERNNLFAIHKAPAPTGEKE